MNKWKAIAGSMVLAGALTAPGLSMAFGPGDHGPQGPGHFRGHMFEHMADELGLTEGQKAQLKANREANREAHKAQREEMRKLRKQLQEAVESGADQATLDSLGAQLGKLEVARMQEMQKMRQQFESVLTDEQKAKLEKMKAEHKARWEERRKDWQDDEE